MNEDLRKWFGKGKEGDWVRVGTDGEIKGDCAREPGEGKPKCMPRSKAHSMGKDDRATAARRKRREDPVADRKGKGNKPVMVNTEEFMMEGNEPTNPSLWSKAKSLAKQKFDVYPSAYANGWAAKYYKSKGGGWKSVSEEAIDEKCWDGYKRVGMKKKGKRMVPNCVPEATDIIAKAKAAVAKKAGAKLKMDPDTGTPDHFTAAMRRKKGLPEEADSKKYPRKGFPEPGDYGYHPNPGLKPQESDSDEDMDVAYKKATEKEGRKPLNAKITEALTRVTSGNKGYGYHGTVEARDDAEKDKRYSAMHRYAKKLVGAAGHLQDAKKPNVMVKHFLDSAHGRHIADNPTDKNITSRFAHFKKSYNPAMHEEVEIEEGVTNPEIKKAYADLIKTPGGSSERKSAIRRYKSLRQNAVKEESELEEAYGMWKVDFPKQHAGKAVAAGSVHVKAQNTAHAHKVAAKRVGVDHKMFKSKVTKSSILPEELEQVNEYNNYRKAGKDPFAARKQYIAMDRAEKKGVMPGSSTSTADAIAAFKAKGGKITKLDTKGNMKEELGKDNEWGTDALRKKYAAMTPGQESMAADKIPSFDPRYDNVTTQHLGLHPVREGYLAEISAKASIARDEFRRKMQKALTDPKNIARAKKVLAKKKEAEKAKEAPHLVMQLRKVVSIGSKVQFQDGQHHTIAPNHADVFMNKYNSAKSSIEKEALQKRAHKSHAEFMRTIAEEAHENCGTPDCCQMCDTAEMGTHHVDSYEAHKGSGDQISPVISHDDEDIRFQDFDEEAFEKELEADVLALSWDDLVDLYDEDEIEYDESPDEEGEDLEEGITPAGRLKKKFNAMRSKSRRMMARNIAIKRVSTPEKLKSRSIRAARRMVYKRLLRNRDMSTVSSAEKTRLEAQIKRMAPMVARLSVRVMPAVRKLEQSRIKNSRTRKKK